MRATAPPRPWVLDAAVEILDRSGRDVQVRVQGASMEPTLSAGDVLAVEVASASLRQGDLLVFRHEGTLVVHRLLLVRRVAGRGRVLRTRGDGTLTLDPRSDAKAVLGRAVAVRRGDGEWRRLRGAGGRAYARAVALLDLFWGASWAAASRLLGGDRGSAPGRLRSWIAAADRAVLRLLHRALFDRLHPAVSAPFREGGDGGRTGTRGSDDSSR